MSGASEVQWRGGPNDEAEVFIGKNRELTINTTLWTMHLHDGITPGGHMLGAKGDVPAHQVSDSSIRFQNPDGTTWGEWIDLSNEATTEQTSIILAAGSVQVTRVTDQGTAEIARVVSEGGDVQILRLSDEGTAQKALVVAQGVTTSGVVEDEGDTQVARVIAEGDTQVAAVQVAADITVLVADIAELESNKVDNENFYIQDGIIGSMGTSELFSITSGVVTMIERDWILDDLRHTVASQVLTMPTLPTTDSDIVPVYIRVPSDGSADPDYIVGTWATTGYVYQQIGEIHRYNSGTYDLVTNPYGGVGRPDGRSNEITIQDIEPLYLSAEEPMDLTRLLEKEFLDARTGVIDGVEGEWEITDIFDLYAEFRGLNTGQDIGDWAYIQHNDFNTGVTVGSSSSIDDNVKLFIVGDSAIYEAFKSIGSSNSFVAIHPKHGDVISDFTIGNTYKVIVCQESTRKSVGDLTHTEIIGDLSQYARAGIVEGTGGVPNVGYFDGDSWASNLPSDGTRTNWSKYKLIKTFSNLADLKEVKVLKDDNTWQTYTLGDGEYGNQYGAYANITDNKVYINIDLSWAGLGYSSLADYRDRVVILVTYQTRSKVFRNATNSKILCNSNVFATTHRDTNYGNALIGNLINSVGIGVPNITLRSANLTLPPLSDTQELFSSAGFEPRHETLELTASNPAMKCFTYLTKDISNNLSLNTVFKEMIWDYDTDGNPLLDIVAGVPYTSKVKGDILRVSNFDNTYLNILMIVTQDFGSGTLISGDYDGFYILDGILHKANGVVYEYFQPWDGNGWGDNNMFEISDNTVTLEDDNGNVVLYGTKSYDLRRKIRGDR